MKVLALAEAPDHVCYRYRIGAFEPALGAAGWTLTVEALTRGLFARLAQIARAGEYDAVILQRKLLPAWQLGELRRWSRRLLFDFDDAVLYRDSYDPRGPHHPRRLARFRRTVRLADEVIAGNAFLAECARDAGADPDRVRVIPTCVDTASARPRAQAHARPSRPEDGIDLAWIGSSSTLAGLERQRPLWEHLGRSVPGLRLRLICDRFLQFGSLPVVEMPWSLGTEADDVAGADVGVSWVPDDLWSRGKCGLKVLQYQAAGLPVVANPVGVHREIIRPGVDGFLAETPDEWVAAVRALRDDADLRARMGRAARASVVARASVAAWSGRFVATVAGARPAPVASGALGEPNFRTRTLATHDR